MLAEDTISELLKVLTGDFDALDYQTDVQVHDFAPGYALDPIARIEQQAEQPSQVDVMTSTVKERQQAEKTYEQQTPGSSAAFRAAEAATMPEPENWFKHHGGGPNGDLSGFIPRKALVPIEKQAHYMKPSAAVAYKAMQKAAKKDGVNFSITDSYRDYDAQVRLKAAKPTLAATPGHSNHGWGLALDVNVGSGTLDDPTYRWLRKHAKRFGFDQPMSYEPWHWEYEGGYKGPSRGSKPKPQQRKQRKTTVPKDEFVDVVNLPTDPLVSLPMPIISVMGEVKAGAKAKTVREFDKVIGLGFVPKRYRQSFVDAARKYNLDPRLLASMGVQESGLKHIKTPNEVGAVGPLQVIPKWHPQFDAGRLAQNYRYNVIAGAAIFASYLGKAKGDLRLALAYYNAGPNASADVLRERMREYSDPILNRFYGRSAA